MKINFYLLVAGILFFSLRANAQCTDATFASQADVNSFPSIKGCSTLPGTVIISGADITNLDSLSALTYIGRLSIVNNPNLASIDGLSGITAIGPTLVISDNPMLPNLDGLRSLRGFGNNSDSANITISNNAVLANADSLSKFNFISADHRSLTVTDNAALTKGCGFYPVMHRYFPCTTCGGTKLEFNGNGVTQEQVFAGGACDGTRITLCGTITLSSQADIDSFPLNYGCKIMLGTLSIITAEGNNLTNLDSLYHLTSIGGLNLSGNPNLTNVDGLSSVTSVTENSSYGDGSIIIQDNPSLVSIHGLKGITALPSSLYINNNRSLTTLSGLSGLEEVSYEIDILNNAALQDVNGLQSLTRMNGKTDSYLRIINNPALTNVDSLSQFIDMTTPRRTLVVRDNPNLTSGCGLYPLIQLSLSCAVCTPIIAITGNGAGVTEEEIRANGDCEGVDSPITAQPTNLVISEVTDTSMRITFTPPRHPADGYVTMMRKGQSPHPDDDPKDGQAWYPGAVYGNSVIVGTYDPDTTFVVSDLEPGTDYYFAIYSHQEFVYVKDEPLMGHQMTSGVAPTLAFSNITDNSMDVSFNADPAVEGYITLMRAFESALPDAAPQNETTYHVGNLIGCCSIVVGMGTEPTLNIIYLEADVDYYFDVIPYAVTDGRNKVYTYDLLATISGHQRTMPHVEPYPNPFVEEVVIPFTIAEENSNVKIVIMDQMGRPVSEVTNGQFLKGKHEARWTRVDLNGNRAGSGVYVYSVTTSGGEKKGMVVAK